MIKDSEIREETVDLGAGVKLHYAEAGDQTGQTLILLHGYTDSWRSYQLVLPLLARNCRVFALDLRGHGDSSAPEGDYSLARLAEDVVTFMSRLDVETATVVGHSMGSFIARRMALDWPRRVERLVLIGSAVTAENPGVRALQHEVNRFQDYIPEEFVESFQASCIYRPKALPEWFFRACVAASRRTPLHVWQAALDELMGEQQAGRLAELTQPTLIIGGYQDTVFSVTEQKMLAQAMSRSQLRLYRYAGHSPQWEEPGRFAEDVEDFLDQPIE